MPHAIIVLHDVHPEAVAMAVARLTGHLGSTELGLQIVVHGERADGWPLLEAVLKSRGLNASECAIIRLDLEGQTRAGIAHQLHLAPGSITTYWKQIYQKLELADRAAVRAWLQRLRQRFAQPFDPEER
ncbi:LuxR C-terminal-related transcriptional regulator [Candidatus Chloroploca asiatica]|uniref:HTH luxR-type domain-containing protein n=1 Tax=Candidatus Chloroploca asiatica TaxID=1506545 RepID=A0A2H3KGH9_9CHLR|nr:LuxR C-terminal-related transcriptional regulator [Candidatus Chloroploca asiatica]PDV96823.1 hypothetical protein A9Q02_20305 [Candidatus Chloroploca asiatica]